jgi:hypothetical protein
MLTTHYFITPVVSVPYTYKLIEEKEKESAVDTLRRDDRTKRTGNTL